MGKTVFDNHGVAHAWAHYENTEGSGRSNNGQFFFEGPALFSYGSHFLVGFLIDFKGARFAVMNADSYSITTSKHQSYARSAVSHLPEIRVPALTRIRYELSKIQEWRKGERERPAGAIQTIREHIVKNWREMGAGDYKTLLEICGLPAASIEKTARDGEKAETQRKAANEKAKFEAQKREAIRYADMSDSDFSERLAKCDYFRAAEGRYRDRHSCEAFSEKLKALRAELIRARNFAKNNLSNKRREKINKRIALVKSELESLELRIQRAQKPKRIASYVKGVRHLFVVKNIPSWQFKSHAESCEALAQENGVGPALRSKLFVIAAGAYTMAAFELEKEKEEQRQRERAAYMEAQERRAAWLRGESVGHYVYSLKDETGGALIRAVDVRKNEAGEITGGELQTSQGARVPLMHAIRAFRFLKMVRESGRAWQANGHTIRVGSFTVDRIEPSGDFVAGCHKINWGEVERLAIELGVFSLPPSDDALTARNAA